MKVKLWGTRGSVARAGPDTVRYGGDTACVELRTGESRLVILDAGSGLPRLARSLESDHERIDIFLTHLHMDHIQGLGFFPALRVPEIETHIWGPISTRRNLAQRLGRYLSPPLFPVRLRDLMNNHVHDVAPGRFRLGSLQITTDLISHPGSTLGYRLEEDGSSLVYMPDHEVALGHKRFPGDPRWTSGFDLAAGATSLIHDAQYTEAAYAERIGWGHSTLRQLLGFAAQAEVEQVVTFHHDPEHPDDMLDRHHAEVVESMDPGMPVVPGKADTEIEV
jgi:phosphoribosyl 1,2-cyclic phosphodiesterase